MHGFNIVILLVTIGFFFGNYVALAVDLCIQHYIHPLTYAIVGSSILFVLAGLWIVMAVWPDGRFKGGAEGKRTLDAYNKVMTSPYYSGPVWIGWGAFFLAFVLFYGLLWPYIGYFGSSPDPQIGSGGIVPFGTSAESDYYFNAILVLAVLFLIETVAQVYHFSAYYRAWMKVKQELTAGGSKQHQADHNNPQNPHGLADPSIAKSKMAGERAALIRENTRNISATSTTLAHAMRQQKMFSDFGDEDLALL